MGNKDLFIVISYSKYPFLILILMWTSHLLNLNLNLHLSEFGIYPRQIEGLKGIIFSPFIHSKKDFSHIINNSYPIIILGWALFYFYRKIAWKIFFYSWFVGGFFVWISARQSFHIGMSGIIYSLAFYLFFSGVFRKDIRLMAISLFVVFLYGSMIWGILPYDWKISFESHFIGAIVGIILAFFFKDEGATFKSKKTQWEIEEEMGIEPPDFEGDLSSEKDENDQKFRIIYQYRKKEKD